MNFAPMNPERQPSQVRRTGGHRLAAQVRGVSLIELMVALVLGLIVTGSALTLFMTNRQTFAATETLGRVQENARIAFELMVRDIRRADSNPCDGSKTPVGSLSGSSWWSDWGTSGVLGYADTTEFTDAGDAAFGTGEGQRVNGTDAIELKSATGLSGGSIVTTELTTLTNAVDVTSVEGLQAGDALVLCNYYQASIFQASGFGGSGAARTVSHTAAIVESDANASANYKENSILARLQATRWYIGNNDRGGTSLYRASLINNSGTLGLAIDEIAEGVSDMTLTYLEDGATSYQAASAGTTWSNVAAVRVVLALEGQQQIDGNTLARSLQHTVAIRSHNR